MTKNKTITVIATVDADIEKVWKFWTEPEHIKKWNNASDDWQTTKAENDLKVGGKFSSRMEAKDGSMGFDFGGTYSKIETQKLLAYSLDDGRKVTIDFKNKENKVEITEVFEPENQNSVDRQKQGWQAILDNFKQYAERQK